MLDGLKPGQRKILYACFKRNLKKDIKVCKSGDTTYTTPNVSRGSRHDARSAQRRHLGPKSDMCQPSVHVSSTNISLAAVSCSYYPRPDMPIVLVWSGP